MNKKTLGTLAVGVLIGVIAAPKLKTLPLLSKLPSA
jgi:hypothetical protein